MQHVQTCKYVKILVYDLWLTVYKAIVIEKLFWTTISRQINKIRMLRGRVNLP